MAKLKNTGRGAKVVPLRGDRQGRMIAPGETAEGEFEDTPVVRAWIEDGSLKLTGDLATAEAAEESHGDSEAQSDDEDRNAQIAAAIGQLGDDDFTATGMPKLDALNAHMPSDAQATREERDAVWAEMSEE